MFMNFKQFSHKRDIKNALLLNLPAAFSRMITYFLSIHGSHQTLFEIKTRISLNMKYLIGGTFIALQKY